MTKIIKNSSNLLLYLVNDMLDVYMLKNGKFQKIEENFILKEILKEIYDMFSFQMELKGLKFTVNLTNRIPFRVTTDQRRVK